MAALLFGLIGVGGWWYVFRAMPAQAEAVVMAARPDTGVRERVSDDTIRLYGPIAPGDDAAFTRVFTPQVRHVLLDPGGGDVATALAIGERMQARGVDVFVTLWCLSSCANYLFLAGRDRIIGARGIVGFHGDFRSAMAGAGDLYGLSQDEVDADPAGFAKTRAEVAALEAREAAFLKRAGVGQSFFDMAQQPGKGAGGEDSYAFVAPGPKMRAAHGIDRVTGEQSVAEHRFLSDYGVPILLTD